jgi:hypothetical protein
VGEGRPVCEHQAGVIDSLVGHYYMDRFADTPVHLFYPTSKNSRPAMMLLRSISRNTELLFQCGNVLHDLYEFWGIH